MKNQIDAKIEQLQAYLKAEFKYCQINRGRDEIRIFYGKDRKIATLDKSEVLNLDFKTYKETL